MRKLIPALLALTLVLTLLPARAAAQPAFSDVPEDAWYAQYVEYCLEEEIMDGLSGGRFGPEEPVTRAVLAQALYRLADRPVVSLEGKEYDSGLEEKDQKAARQQAVYPFSDVDPQGPHASAILWAWQEGFITGYDDGTFGPDDPITREQMAVILWQTQGRQLSQRAAPFADRADISPWAIDAVEWAWSVGLMGGKDDGLFDYAGHTTRAEGAAILLAYERAFLSPPDPAEPTEPAGPASPEAVPVAPNRYNSALYAIDGSFLTYQWDGPSHVGVDVSSHQQQIDWSQVAAAGVDFAMIRAGYRGYYNPTLNKDRYFDDNIRGALANGLDVGVYFFSQAVTVEEAREEAYLLLEWLEGYDITYPVVFDWESVDEESSRTRDTDGQTVTQCALAFCSIIEQAGYLPMTYGSPSKIYAGGIQLEYLQDYPFWLAHYTTGWAPTSYRYHYDMWQYSSNGTVPGIPTRVDLNVCLADWSLWGRS